MQLKDNPEQLDTSCLLSSNLLTIRLRGASNNALIGLIKPPAMPVVMTYGNL